MPTSLRPLLYVHPGPLATVDGDLHLPARTVTALREYARHLDRQVMVTGYGTQNREAAPGEQSIQDETAFAPVVGTDAADTVRSVNPGVVLALHHPASEPLLQTGNPIVLTTEFSRPIRAGMSLAEAAGPLNRARIVAGSWRAEGAYRSMARRAAGLQANGPSAWGAYGHLNSRSLMFHDHRITAADVAESRRHTRWGEPVFRVAFSGRLIRAKGAHLLVPIARELARLAPSVEIVVLGAGQWKETLQAANPQNVRLLGFKDFETEWIPYVQSQVDLMLLPHVQGDPSCTYFEAWGCGAPVAGFHNETLSRVVGAHACGWTAGRGDVAGLVRRIARLSQRTADFMEARNRGLDLVAAHTFEAESRRRIEMLQAIASSQ